MADTNRIDPLTGRGSLEESETCARLHDLPDAQLDRLLDIPLVGLEPAESDPLHVVCARIGNSRRVAQEHGLQVTDDHFRAASRGIEAAQNPAQRPAASCANQALARHRRASVGRFRDCNGI